MTQPSNPKSGGSVPLLDVGSALEAALADAEAHAREKHGAAPEAEWQLPEVDDSDEDDDPGDLFAGMGGDADDEAAPDAATDEEQEAKRALRDAAKRVREVASGGELELLRNQVKHLRDRLKDEDGRAVRAERQLAVVTNDLKQTRKRFSTVAERETELNNRIERQKVELPQNARNDVLSALLPALDTTDLLIKNLQSDDSLGPDAQQAVEILEKDWKRAFANLQIQPFDAIGQKFDPVVHAAISEVESAEIAPGTCVRQVGRGYLVEHRLLRSAQVVVSKAPE